MDVHGTKLARTLFTIATGVERGEARQRLLDNPTVVAGVPPNQI